MAAYALQDGGLDTVDANRHLGFDDDLRSYEAVEYILSDMGIKVQSLFCLLLRLFTTYFMGGMLPKCKGGTLSDMGIKVQRLLACSLALPFVAVM